ncbi:hypothetical protein [Candidatus Villigracilis saccharophilus]|uniref:energy-coupling factor transporter transmembrane component T n=1 Tax=Candidatus Villigracilis saccharophilus TaxID=3140684 RepID=UPI003135BAC9|nr:hypothetical protein [Anaerolineales bacterium]
MIWLLRTLADAGQLVMMTTHDLNPASHADRFILLRPSGETIADDLTEFGLARLVRVAEDRHHIAQLVPAPKRSGGREMRINRGGRSSHQLTLVENSPLRSADPRTKLFLSLAISLVVMTSIERLLIFLVCICYSPTLALPSLHQLSSKHIWRLFGGFLIFLFAFDWWLISLDHAVLICIRLVLLTGVFALFFSTTNTRELGPSGIGNQFVPYRYAFSLSLAFQSPRACWMMPSGAPFVKRRPHGARAA